MSGDVSCHAGLTVTTPERTLVDLAPHLTALETARAFREAIRLGVTTTGRLAATLDRHPGRRGKRGLTELCRRYADLAYARARSNAEARALEVLADAGEELPLVNVSVAGEEADLVWLKRKQIIEIDGPQYHLFPDEDERKARRWRRAGFTVQRISSDAIYNRPGELVRLAREQPQPRGR